MEVAPSTPQAESLPRELDLRLLNLILDLSSATIQLAFAVKVLTIYAPQNVTSRLEAAGEEAFSKVGTVRANIQEIIAEHGKA